MLRKLLSSPIYRRTERLAIGRVSQRQNSSTNDLNEYHEASDNTLEELSDELETILEDRYDQGADVSLNTGVLTVVVNKDNTFVVNKQTPNRQIWLSSPISGPMRFDLSAEGKWIEKFTKVELKELVTKELHQLLKNQSNC